jgi:hypothetical protein
MNQQRDEELAVRARQMIVPWYQVTTMVIWLISSPGNFRYLNPEVALIPG